MQINSIALQSDGMILIGGLFTSYNNTPANYIIRLTTTGAVDSTFIYGTGFVSSSGGVRAVAVQSDKKILVGGNFSSYNSTLANNIIRLNN